MFNWDLVNVCEKASMNEFYEGVNSIVECTNNLYTPLVFHCYNDGSDPFDDEVSHYYSICMGIGGVTVLLEMSTVDGYNEFVVSQVLRGIKCCGNSTVYLVDENSYESFKSHVEKFINDFNNREYDWWFGSEEPTASYRKHSIDLRTPKSA